MCGPFNPARYLLAALLAQAANALKIKFSPIVQCGAFNVSFTGTSLPAAALPLSLTIVPLNSSTPLQIPIGDPNWDAQTETGAAVTFLPLPAGTQFVASLDDANGKPTGFPSDIIEIQPSDNSSCISQQLVDAPRQYTFPVTLEQCEDLTVTYDETLVGTPSVRAFIPSFFSFDLNETSAAGGVATYTTSIHRGFSTLLLLDDGNGHRETSGLIAVGGDTASSSACIPKFHTNNTTTTASTKKQTMSSQAGIAIGAASGGIVGSIVLIFSLYLYRRRLRERQRILFDMESAQDEKKGRPSMASSMDVAWKFPPSSAIPTAHLSPPAPPFLLQAAPSGRAPNRRKGTASTFSYPEDPQTMYEHAEDWGAVPRMPEPAALRSSPGARQSFAELDIERVLEMATMYDDAREPLPRPGVPATPVASPSPTRTNSRRWSGERSATRDTYASSNLNALRASRPGSWPEPR